MVGRVETRGVVSALGWVALGSMVANVLAYAVHLGAGRWWLSTGDYGQFAVLLSALLVFSVPALAVQAVVAREVVHGRDDPRLRQLGLRTAAVVVGIAALGVPLLMWITSSSAVLVVAGVAAAPLLAVVGAGQGVLQGRGEFRLLAWTLAGVGLLRTIPVMAALALGAGPIGGLSAGALGAALAATVVWVAVRVTRPTSAPESHPMPVLGSERIGLAAVARAAQVQLVLVVAASVDLLLAPNALDRAETGVYALGAIATKAAFWLPQAVGVVFYPSLADPATSRHSLRRAIAVVAGAGAVVTVLAAIAGPLIPFVIGPDYRDLVWLLGLFAFTGSVLSILQVALLSAIARDATGVALIAWSVVAIEATAIVLLVDSVLQLAVTAAVAATISAVITTLYCLRVVAADSPADDAVHPADVVR